MDATSIQIVVSELNPSESEVLEIADISYHSDGASIFMALPTSTGLFVVSVGSIRFCAFGVVADACVMTDPVPSDSYDGIGFDDVYKIRAAAITDAAGNPNAELDSIPRPAVSTERAAESGGCCGRYAGYVDLGEAAASENGSPIIRYEYQAVV